MPSCKYNECKTESSFNFKGMPRKYCSKHKEEGMITPTKKKNETKFLFFYKKFVSFFFLVSVIYKDVR